MQDVFILRRRRGKSEGTGLDGVRVRRYGRSLASARPFGLLANELIWRTCSRNTGGSNILQGRGIAWVAEGFFCRTLFEKCSDVS